MSSSIETLASFGSVSSVDENNHQADPLERNSGPESDAINTTIVDNQPILIVNNCSPNLEAETPLGPSGAPTATSSNTLQGDEERSRATTANRRPELGRHPSEWNNDEVLGWFQSYKLDELYNSLFYPNDAKDGDALVKIFELKLKNYDRYRVQYTSRLTSNQANLLKDFDRFGQMLDTYFIDKYVHRFDVAFSFPGDIRDRVSEIAERLSLKINRTVGEQRIFYDNYHKAELARPNLDLYLQTIYRYQTRLIVVFMCKDYKHKEWCGLESRAIRSLLKQGQSDRIMLLTVDGEVIDGVFDIDGYLNIKDESVDDVANAIYSRLEALGEPLPPSRSLLPLPRLASSPSTISRIIAVWKSVYNPLIPWFLIVGLISYHLGTLRGR